ncbi:MAG: hypothetical protein V4458_06110 [Pseudomonadota bacterium]
MRREFKFTPQTLVVIKRDMKAGKSDVAIARLLGCEVTTLQMICAQHGIRRQSDSVNELHQLSCIPVPVQNRSLRKIEQEAKRRGVTSFELSAKILNCVALDDMFSAVLDD